MTVLYCPRNDHLHTHGVRAALYKATHGFCTNLAPPACLCLKTIPYPYGSGFVPNWRAPRATLNPKLSLFHPFSPCHDKDYTPSTRHRVATHAGGGRPQPCWDGRVCPLS